tara:strand:+ start:1212 stop:1661 length:450 start_codon:yes stop_codon:yes gene_type:complete
MKKKQIENILKSGIPIYGDLDYRNKSCPLETPEQITAVGHIRKTMPTLGDVLVHIKNEGKRRRGAAKEKVAGMITGASDLIAPGCPAFTCEVKREDHTQSEISDDQINYLIAAKKAGSFVCVALGHKGVIEAAKDWEKLNHEHIPKTKN